jgi:DNA/RNA endonuclease YhcR with UshA esterase domain
MLCAATFTFMGRADDQTVKPKAGIEKITAAEAEKFIGKEAIVVDKVAHVRQTEKITHINFGPAYPNQTFTAVVFARATNQFEDLTKLTGRTVEVRGHIEEYNGKPQIILNTKEQLKVLDAAEKPAANKPAAVNKPAMEKSTLSKSVGKKPTNQDTAE